MLFAKSSDRPLDEPQVLEWLPARSATEGSGSLRTTYISVPDAGALAVLGSRPTWMWGLEHGFNARGVAIGNEKVWTVDDPRAVPPALTGMDLVRLGLERGTSADHAVDVIIDLLENHGQGGSCEAGRDEPYWSSFLVVDAVGGWVIETSGRTWVADVVGGGAAISNRLTLSTGWRRGSADVEPGEDWDRWRPADVPTGIADDRLAATRRWVGLGAGASPAAATGMLRDHGTGPWGTVGAPAAEVVAPPETIADDWSGITVCMHVRGYQCTTASMIAELPASAGEPLRAWASLGTPCTGVFLPVAVLDGDAVMPAVLGDVDAWWTFAGLSRAVEAAGDAGRSALVAVRAALAPVEESAWLEAEELWARQAGADRWRAAAAAWDVRVRAALAALAPRAR
jgi:hypothetical protein